MKIIYIYSHLNLLGVVYNLKLISSRICTFVNFFILAHCCIAIIMWMKQLNPSIFFFYSCFHFRAYLLLLTNKIFMHLTRSLHIGSVCISPFHRLILQSVALFFYHRILTVNFNYLYKSLWCTIWLICSGELLEIKWPFTNYQNEYEFEYPFPEFMLSLFLSSPWIYRKVNCTAKTTYLIADDTSLACRFCFSSSLSCENVLLHSSVVACNLHLCFCFGFLFL